MGLSVNTDAHVKRQVSVPDGGFIDSEEGREHYSAECKKEYEIVW